MNGDCAVEVLSRSGVAGDTIVYADILHDGPVRDLTADAHMTERARFIADAGIDTYESALRRYGSWDDALARHAAYDEVVLWVEHDLFDQLLLIRNITWLSRHGRSAGVSLVQTDDYIGSMEPGALAAHYPARIRIGEEHRAVAERAWSAFVCDTPCDLQALLDTDTSPLPHLHTAIARLLEEVPAVADGLGRLDRQIRQLQEQGITDPHRMFAANAALEERIYLGDTTFFWRAATIGQPRWIGGTLFDGASPWRYDTAAQRVVNCGSAS